MAGTARHRDIYGGKDPRDLGAYTPTEAARYLHVPLGTLRAWVLGQKSWNRTNPFRPVIEIADRPNKLLSFRNLVELHVLSSLRRGHRVPLSDVRKLVSDLKKKFASNHPLADAHLAADDAGHLFVDIAGRVFNVSQDWQQEMRPIIDEYLRRIERDEHNVPIKLFPFTSPRLADTRRPVVIDPRVQFGRPCLAGTGIPVDVLLERFQAGDSIDALAKDYRRSPDEIEDAIRFHHMAPAAA